MAQARDCHERLSRVAARDGRYHEEAYSFVLFALDRAVRGLEAKRHVSGTELLRAIREEALDQFGPMVRTVLEHWGVKNSLDFGRIVFNMVEEGILLKSETDRLEDFEGVLDLESLFDTVAGYRLSEQEARRRPARMTEKKSDG